MADNQNRDYRDKRALMLLRVSTPSQEEMYGWHSQEKEIRQKLIGPLGLKLDEERHIIRDTYTGLEFRERPALARILEIAERGEIDVLVMDVLDRLGRRGLPREIFRMQLREKGVRILTTDPSDHADDDSLVGEMIRILKGYQAEDELNNIKRRTMNGKRLKATGEKDGNKRVIGNGSRLYGYEYTYEDTPKGKKRAGLTPNHDVLLVEDDGTVWTEVKVVIFIFRLASTGTPLKQIARILNSKGIPSPAKSKGLRTVTHKNGGDTVWQPSAVNRILKNRAYIGEQIYFQIRTTKESGNKIRYEKTPKEEHVIVPITPLIITEDGKQDIVLFEKIQDKLKQNKKLAPRNNRQYHKSLLRAGFVKCAECGGNMVMDCRYGRYKGKEGPEADQVVYRCARRYNSLNKCSGCSINVYILDAVAWERILEIIRDPSQVDKEVARRRSEDPTVDRRRQISLKLTDIRDEQSILQETLAKLIKERKLDLKTEDFLAGRLRELASLEDDYMRELAADKYEHEKWKKLQEKLNELHQVCSDIRKNLDDSNYELPYEKKRELCEFFGIQATVWKTGHNPRFEIKCNPPSIVSHFP